MTQPTRADLAARVRKDAVRARNRRRRRTQRLNQQERAHNLRLSPVVVQLPAVVLDGIRGQTKGEFRRGRSDRWIQESHARLTRERAQAAEAAARG